MKLYEVAMSPFAGRCRMVIYHKGIADKFQFLPPPAMPHSPEWRAINPLGKLPALETGSVILAESEVIVEYLDDKFPERPILPRSAEDRALARLLARICDLYLFAALAPLFGQSKASPRDPAVVDDGLAKVGQALDSLEHFLPDGAGPYAVGGALTTADCAMVNTFFYVNRLLRAFDVTGLIEQRPKLARYWTEIQREPTAARVLAELGHGLDHYIKTGSFVAPPLAEAEA